MKTKKIAKGDFDDQKIIKLMVKHIPKEDMNKMSMAILKRIGKTMQERLKHSALPLVDLQELVSQTFANPPKEESVEVVIPVVPTWEEKKAEENKSISVFKGGEEEVHFSEKGMNNLLSEDNDLYELSGKDKITGHEDDGRIYKSQKVRRKSDGKMFVFYFVWHPEWPNTFFDNIIFEVNQKTKA